jgi:hypothetical protein
MLHSDFSNTGHDINADIDLILKPNDPSWREGKDPIRPWNWYGPFTLDPNVAGKVTFGYGSNVTAILQVVLSNGQVFWMFTAAQNYNFEQNQAYWEK